MIQLVAGDCGKVSEKNSGEGSAFLCVCRLGVNDRAQRCRSLVIPHSELAPETGPSFSQGLSIDVGVVVLQAPIQTEPQVAHFAAEVDGPVGIHAGLATLIETADQLVVAVSRHPLLQGKNRRLDAFR